VRLRRPAVQRDRPGQQGEPTSPGSHSSGFCIISTARS
jgi:hypothetical protein